MRPILLLLVLAGACAGPDSPVGASPQAGPGLVDRIARAAAPEASPTSPAPVPPEPTPAAEGPRIITQSACLTDPSDRIRSQTEPTRHDHLHLTVRHMGKTGSAERIGQVANPVSWDVGHYTGLVVPSPRDVWQRGFYDAGPPHGTNAFQVYCTGAGSMINSWSFDHTEEIVGGGPHSAWEISYAQPTTPFGAESSALVLEADLAVPWIASWNGGVGQLSFFVYLRERTSDRVFAYVLGAFDNRPLGDQAGFEFFQRRRARLRGQRVARARSNAAVTFVQRFNSALELSLHFHMLVPDGVFVAGYGGVDERPRFVGLKPPSNAEVAKLLVEVARRVTRMLHAHGRLLDDEIDEDAEPQLMFAGRTVARSGGPQRAEALPARCARQDGYSLHAGRRVHEDDRVGLEELARYGLRPALSQERLREAGDGTVLYEMKRRFSDGRQTLRFTPRELLLRLCALVPPRGFHMVRYHGIFAPHARGRFALTGRGMRDCPAEPLAVEERAEPTCATAEGPTGETAPPRPAITAATMLHDPVARPAARAGAVLRAPDDATRARRLEWSLLMKRAYALDVLSCPRCQGPMRLIAVIDNELVARRILQHLGLPARAPPRGRGSGSGQDHLPGLDAAPEPAYAFDGVDLLPVETC